MNARLLFVAAGLAQTPVLREARRCGYHVIAMDADPEAPGFEHAHERHVADIRDAVTICRVAETARADGILCISCDGALSATAEACQRLGLPGISPAMAAMSENKALQRAALECAGLSVPRHLLLEPGDTVDVLLDMRDDLPFVVKPVDSSGSRGVSLVEQESALEAAVASARQHSRSSRVLVERFIPGNEYSVEAWVHDGTVHVLGSSMKRRSTPPALLDREVHFPTGLDVATQATLLDQATRAIIACGYDRTAVHVECILSPTGPVIVELAARGAGFRVFSEILPRISGIDIAQACIDTALGIAPTLEPIWPSLAASLIFIDPVQGRFSAARGVEAARSLCGVHEVVIYRVPGDTMRSLNSGSDRVGHLIVYAENPSRCREIAVEARRLIRIETCTEKTDSTRQEDARP